MTVSGLGFGSGSIGGMYEAVNDAEAIATVRRAHELGIRYFDVAPLYGYGLAEHRIGEALAPLERSSFVLSTKVGRLLRADAPPDPGTRFLALGGGAVHPIFDFSSAGVRRSVEESLHRLGLNRIDLLYLHDPDDHWEQALTEAYPALQRMRREGVVAAIGVGMNRTELLTRFAREVEFDAFLVAGRYTLLDQSAITELLPLCTEKGISVVIGGVMNSGILADPKPGAPYNYAPAPRHLIQRVERLRAICERHGTPLRAAALQFPAAHPAVASILIGVRSVEHLEDSFRMAQVPIPVSLWDELISEGLLPSTVPIPSDTQD